MKYKNLTIKGKTDGFGCQYNAILSGIAYCEKNAGYRYVHTPFSSVSHGYTSKEDSEKLNILTGIPNNSYGKKIHVAYKYMKNVFNNPKYYYDQAFRDKIREYYWKNKQPVNTDIVVHIRRGDMDKNYRCKGTTRYIPNSYYNKLIPNIVRQYPDHYSITIHSEGEMSEFDGILKNWTKQMADRVIWKLGESFKSDCQFDLISAFHDMVCAKVLVQSKSGLSYTAGVLNKNLVYFMSGNRSVGQGIPLDDWIVI
jgi:hypothetical protein